MCEFCFREKRVAVWTLWLLVSAVVDGSLDTHLANSRFVMGICDNTPSEAERATTLTSAPGPWGVGLEPPAAWWSGSISSSSSQSGPLSSSETGSGLGARAGPFLGGGPRLLTGCGVALGCCLVGAAGAEAFRCWAPAAADGTGLPAGALALAARTLLDVIIVKCLMLLCCAEGRMKVARGPAGEGLAQLLSPGAVG